MANGYVLFGFIIFDKAYLSSKLSNMPRGVNITPEMTKGALVLDVPGDTRTSPAPQAGGLIKEVTKGTGEK